MPRPPKCRLVRREPSATFFKPRGVPLRSLKLVTLSIEGYEAIRLSDLEGLDQDAASIRMGVSRQTFGRILARARKQVARAVVNGCGLEIEGGHYQVVGPKNSKKEL